MKILQPLDQGFWSKATTSPPKLISEFWNSKTLRVSSKDPLEILVTSLALLSIRVVFNQEKINDNESVPYL